MWTAWSACSVTCGGGNQSRARSCDNPAPLGSGAKCPGLKLETQDCSKEECPISE